jgi:hypothetical protein
VPAAAAGMATAAAVAVVANAACGSSNEGGPKRHRRTGSAEGLLAVATRKA